MKISILQGSPRAKGNTAQVVSWMREEMAGLGHDVELVSLVDKDMKGCLACAKCKADGSDINCVQDDDAIGVLETMIASDLVVLASPLYFWGVSAQLKTVIDRSYSLYVQYHQPDHASLMEGKKLALVLTGGGPLENNAEAAITAFQRLNKPYKSLNAGELFVGRCSTPDTLGSDREAEARSFARTIVGAQ